MPFTPSHAVVALPFVRSPLVPAAIAIGAMTPDLPLFVRGLPLHYGRTHDMSWLGATVLLALVLLLVWRCVLRPAVRELVPDAFAVRLPATWDGGAVPALRETFLSTDSPAEQPRRRTWWASVALLVVSLLIGVMSHIVWDLFTHEGRWGVVTFPALGEQWGPFLGFKWLQYGSSVLGLTIVAIWALLWLRKSEPAAPPHRVLASWVRVAWLVSLPVILAGAWVWGLAAFGPLTAEWTIPHLAYRVLPPACAVWGALTVALCVAVQILRRTRQSSAHRRPPALGEAGRGFSP